MEDKGETYFSFFVTSFHDPIYYFFFPRFMLPTPLKMVEKIGFIRSLPWHHQFFSLIFFSFLPRKTFLTSAIYTPESHITRKNYSQYQHQNVSQYWRQLGQISQVFYDISYFWQLFFVRKKGLKEKKFFGNNLGFCKIINRCGWVRKVDFYLRSNDEFCGLIGLRFRPFFYEIIEQSFLVMSLSKLEQSVQKRQKSGYLKNKGLEQRLLCIYGQNCLHFLRRKILIVFFVRLWPNQFS